MSDRREASARSPGAANGRTPPGPGSDRERVLLLECRLEEMQAALNAARDEADHVRSRLAEAAAKETRHARRFCLIHEELAEARAEIAILHRHLDRSEALRAELAGHLFEAGPTADAEELVRLRRRAMAEDQRASMSDRTIARLRERVDELLSSREILLTRIAEWQRLIREDGSEAADLSEFLSELRREILDLEHRSATSDVREARLRERLALAGVDPDVDEVEASAASREEAPTRVAAVFDTEVDPPGQEPREREAAPAVTVSDVEPPAAGTDREEDAPIAGTGRDEEAPTAEVDHAEAARAPEVATDGRTSEAPSMEALRVPDVALEVDPAATDEKAAAPAPEVAPDVPAASPPPTVSPTDALVSELLDAQLPELRAELLLRLGRTGDPEAAGAIGPWTKSSEPSVRAAAYEALGRLLERRPEELEPHVRSGLGDQDARVRRRVVLAAVTARGLEAHALLDPLREDPDPQVRRLIRQVLRQAPTAGGTSEPQRPSRV